MKKTNLRKNNGITLIALVITIIVLLILAGVAIAMLSGENGILRKATEAKTKTEEGQKQEETGLATMELETYFLTSNSKYKCSNGFITGIKVGTKVSELQSALPDGYTVKAIDETDNFTAKDPTDGQPIVTTGLAIQKDNKTVVRTVIFGDVDCDGGINVNDANRIANGNYTEDYQKVAANLYEDTEINVNDLEVCKNSISGLETINQFKSIYKPANMLKREYTEMQKYMTKVNEETSYKIEYNEETDTYTLKGIADGTTVKQLKDAMPENDTISIAGYKPADDTPICNKHYIIKKVSKTVQTENGDVVYSTNTKIIIEI